ncbi:MAG: dihydroorotate dehydrogenase electron transfer subunit [Bacteroidetes bacterium]|nr:dihydroorotate dehydrogenase electron transfer subunit [Bacteroidota bacterium]MCL1969602.1 dihydroorotate dehydrogenase electron transfer subunit [Bacteroidota bacterium]
MQFYNSKIISQKKIATDIFHLVVAKKDEIVVPGQFYMLKAWDDGLPLMRPISVYNVEIEQLHFLYKVVGKGTEWLSKLRKGEKIELLGPLGNGFPCNEVSGKIALVGGGIGIPPLFETAKLLTKNGCKVDVYLGYKDELFAFEPFEKVCENIFIAAENGKEGYKGFITDIFHAQNYDAVFTCGPEMMMRKVTELCDARQVPIWLSMENRMACGIGACLVCTCKTKEGMKRCCKDGPVFFGKILDN